MRLELKDIKEGCLELSYSIQPTDFPVLKSMIHEGDLNINDPIVFSLRLQKAGLLVETEGQLKTRTAFTCGRCLQPFTQQIEAEFAFTFTPYLTEVESEEEEVELDSDELGLIYYKDETLDLLPPLQDQLVMALPIAPMCSNFCAGLCSECGVDLNKTKCTCEKKPFNNKFSALSGVKIEPSEK